MNDERRSVSKRKLNGDKVEVAAWVMAVTYVICWGFGIAIIVSEVTGYIVYRPLLIVLSVYLIFWPVFQANPAELIRRVFPG